MSGAEDLARLTQTIDKTDELLLSPEIKMVEVSPGVFRPTNAMVMTNLATLLGGAMPYPSVALGLAGTADGTNFSVLSSADDEYMSVYRNESGAAAYVDSYPNAAKVRALEENLGVVDDKFGQLIGPTSYPSPEVEILVVADGEGGRQALLSDKRLVAPSFEIVSEGGATIVGDAEGGAAFYSDDARTYAGPLEIQPSDLPGLFVVDEFGGVLGAFDGRSIDESTQTKPFEGGLLFSPVIAVAENGASSIHVQSLLPRREQAPQVVATIASTTTSTSSSGAVLAVRPADLGGAAVLNLRTLDKPDDRRFLNLAIKSVPVQATPVPIKILLIADSIGNNQGAMLLEQYLVSLGYAPTFIGTLNGTTTFNGSGILGPLGEARSGWETGDFTYAVTDRSQIVAPGGEAAYLAMTKTAKVEYNPFLRAATGGDPGSIVRNGYVFDVAFYKSRFGLDTPDVVINALGTNDARDRSSEEVYASVYANDVLMHSQIKAAFPAAKIIRTLPATSVDSARNALWSSHYVQIIRAMQAAAVASANPLLSIAPLWAMTNPEGGYSLPDAAPGSDGFIAGDWSDPIHPFGASRHGYYKALAPFVAAAALNLI